MSICLAPSLLMANIPNGIMEEVGIDSSYQLGHSIPGFCVVVPHLPLQLAPDDAWRCPHCQVLQQGMVKLSLWTLPDILIIHLKRFRQVGEQRHKLSTLVHFPLRGLDMAPHVAKRSRGSKWGPWRQPLPEEGQCNFLYDLYAVCNHHGSLHGGHYTGEFSVSRQRLRLRYLWEL